MIVRTPCQSFLLLEPGFFIVNVQGELTVWDREREKLVQFR